MPQKLSLSGALGGGGGGAPNCGRGGPLGGGGGGAKNCCRGGPLGGGGGGEAARCFILGTAEEDGNEAAVAKLP